jgi:predicted DNA-binding protein with PD1-like motif
MRASRLLPLLASFTLLHCASHPAFVVTQVPFAHAKLVAQHGDDEEVQLVLEPKAEIVATLVDFIRKNGWQSVHFEGIGACTDAVVGYYDAEKKAYVKLPFTQQMEIVSLIGDAAPSSPDNKIAGFHAHIGLGFADGTLHGGHLFEAHVSPTLELLVKGSRVPIERRHDPAFNADLLVP